MSTGLLLALIVVGAAVTWFIGSFALRAFGLLLVVAGIVNLAIDSDLGLAGSLLAVVVGVVLWLAGHWLFAFKHHVFASALARRMFEGVLPSALNPTRKWGIRTVEGG